MVGHGLSLANEIDELMPNAVDWNQVSAALEKLTGVSLFDLRRACDGLNTIEKEARERAEQWHREHMSEENGKRIQD
jgi:hypothetical protein